jgi:AcrR family transcriptional regulator
LVVVTESASSEGLRERKKRRRRQAILDTAFQLFSKQGYDATTMTQIAETVELAESTVFKYFPTKLEIVFTMLDAIVESARATLLERPSADSPIAAVSDWIENDVPKIERPHAVRVDEIPRIVAGSPGLQNEKRLRIAQIEDIFAQAFAEGLDGDPDGLEAQVLATIALRGMKDVSYEWYRSNTNDGLETYEVCRQTAEYLRQALPAALAMIQELPQISAGAG